MAEGTKIERAASTLTEAQRRALTGAIEMSDGSGLYPRLAVRIDVRRSLHGKGLIGTRPGHPLTKLGREVREHLLRGGR